MKKVTRAVFDVLSIAFWGIISLLIFVVTIQLIYTYTTKAYQYSKDFFSEVGEITEVTVVIPQNADVDEVATLLEKKGIIKSAMVFQLESILKSSTNPYPGGEFTLSNKMDINEINSILRVTAKKDITITIREGYTLKEIGEYLEGKEIVTASEFLEACNEEYEYSFLKNLPKRKNRLEGYLFPDTYFISYNAEPKEIINKMLARFEEIYDKEYEERADELGLTMDEVITIASVIEKEVNRSEELPLVASVIYNRLKDNMKLEMCSTVLYVLDKRKDRLLDEDLKVKSPYNTYLNEGLPPGPISNPSKASINAALHPQDSPYLYFVLKDAESGEHFFTSDYAAFLDAKNKYNQKY